MTRMDRELARDMIPQPVMTAQEIETEVRWVIVDIDDRAVAFQVAQSISSGRPSWFTVTGAPSFKAAGPPTLEVHKREMVLWTCQSAQTNYLTR